MNCTFVPTIKKLIKLLRGPDDNVLNHIANDSHARTLWEKLEKLYASKTGNNKLFLLKQAMNLRYKDGSSISDHLSEFQGCFDQLSGMGVKFEDEILALWLLNTLPDSWENLRVTLTSAAPGGTVTMEYVKNAVLNEEVRRHTQQESSSQSEVLVTENRGRSKEKDQGQGRGRHKSRSKSRSKYKDLECDHCGKKGHIKRFCFKLKNKSGNKSQNKSKDDDKDDRVSVSTSEDPLTKIINTPLHSNTTPHLHLLSSPLLTTTTTTTSYSYSSSSPSSITISSSNTMQ